MVKVKGVGGGENGGEETSICCGLLINHSKDTVMLLGMILPLIKKVNNFNAVLFAI